MLFPSAQSSHLYTVSGNSAVGWRLKVLYKRTHPLDWMCVYSQAHSAEPALLLSTTSSKVLFSHHHWLAFKLSLTVNLTTRSIHLHRCVYLSWICACRWAEGGYVRSVINLCLNDSSPHVVSQGLNSVLFPSSTILQTLSSINSTRWGNAVLKIAENLWMHLFKSRQFGSEETTALNLLMWPDLTWKPLNKT